MNQSKASTIKKEHKSMNTKYDIKFIIRTIGQRPTQWYNINNYAELRYNGFLKGLPDKKVGFIQYQDILNKLYQNTNIPVYEFNSAEKKFNPTANTGLDATVVATEVFEAVPVDFKTKKQYITDTLSLFEELKKEGRVHAYVNSINSTKSQDKNWLLDVQRDLPEIPLSPVYSFNDKKSLEEFFYDSKKSHILKGRLGMAGVGTMLLNEENLDKITDETISHYVIQEDISPVVCELRLVYGPNQTHLGSRAYFDRRAPWDEKETSNKKHTAIEYIVSEQEKDISSKIISYAGVDVGSADWLISLPKGTSIPQETNTKEFSKFIQEKGIYSLAEVNGFGTNLGPLVSPYDLNEEVASRIAKKYI